MHTLHYRKRGTAMFRNMAHDLDGEMTIRRLGAADASALERVAGRDTAEVPRGTVYGVLAADGSILAAISLETRALVADPFVPSAHAAALLRVWTGELDRERGRAGVGGLGVAPAAAAAPC